MSRKKDVVEEPVWEGPNPDFTPRVKAARVAELLRELETWGERIKGPQIPYGHGASPMYEIKDGLQALLTQYDREAGERLREGSG